MIKRGKNKIGKIIKIGGVNTWGHEDFIANALARIGYTVKFVPAHNSFRSADAYIENTLFEFKSPDSDNIKSVINNLEKALKHQSKNIVITSLRMKKVQDRSIRSYLVTKFRERKGIKRLIFVDKQGNVIDIGELSR